VPSHSLTDLVGLSVISAGVLAAVLEAAAQPIRVVDPDRALRFADLAAITAPGYDSAGERSGRRSHEMIYCPPPDSTR
jgi:PAS domain-containing protein